VRLPDEAAAISAWRVLLEGGVYVNLAMPPATPQGVFLLRCSLSAAHTQAQIDRVLDVFAAVARRFGRPAPA
jgi:8-amino-7-oxononanoate synthase